MDANFIIVHTFTYKFLMYARIENLDIPVERKKYPISNIIKKIIIIINFRYRKNKLINFLIKRLKIKFKIDQ